MACGMVNGIIWHGTMAPAGFLVVGVGELPTNGAVLMDGAVEEDNAFVEPGSAVTTRPGFDEVKVLRTEATL